MLFHFLSWEKQTKQLITNDSTGVEYRVARIYKEWIENRRFDGETTVLTT